MVGMIKFDIPEGTEPTKCKSYECKALIYWIKTGNGKNMPVNPDGTSHFATCPAADKFRHYDPAKDPRRPEQVLQFGQLLQKTAQMTKWDANLMQAVKVKFSRGKELTKGEASALFELSKKYL